MCCTTSSPHRSSQQHVRLQQQAPTAVLTCMVSKARCSIVWGWQHSRLLAPRETRPVFAGGLVTFHPFPSHMARETAPPVAASKWYKKFGGSRAAVVILLSPSLSSQFTVHLLFILAWLVLRLIARLILQDADVQVLFFPHSCDLEVFR